MKLVFHSVSLEPNPVNTEGDYKITCEIEDRSETSSVLGLLILGQGVLGESEPACVLGDLILGMAQLGQDEQ